MITTNAFQGLILREFLLEENLRNEFNYVEIASWLGELIGEPVAVAVDTFLTGNILAFVNAGMTQKIIVRLVHKKNTTLLLRAASDILALMKSPEDNYQSCCRSALCHAIQGSWNWGFGALRVAASKHDDWARHHHIYGLIHGAMGDFDAAIHELERAVAAEPYETPRSRIQEAIALIKN